MSRGRHSSNNFLYNILMNQRDYKWITKSFKYTISLCERLSRGRYVAFTRGNVSQCRIESSGRRMKIDFDARVWPRYTYRIVCIVIPTVLVVLSYCTYSIVYLMAMAFIVIKERNKCVCVLFTLIWGILLVGLRVLSWWERNILGKRRYVKELCCIVINIQEIMRIVIVEFVLCVVDILVRYFG